MFLTHITYHREPILETNADLLRESVSKYRLKYAFDLHAWVVLPDHLHLLLTHLQGNPSQLFRKIKLSFSARLRARLGEQHGRVWQNRFWGRVIRDDREFNTKFNYIHYNPVKHGYVTRASDWQHSSMRRYIVSGFLDADWGTADRMTFEGEFGE